MMRLQKRQACFAAFVAACHDEHVWLFKHWMYLFLCSLWINLFSFFFSLFICIRRLRAIFGCRTHAVCVRKKRNCVSLFKMQTYFTIFMCKLCTSIYNQILIVSLQYFFISSPAVTTQYGLIRRFRMAISQPNRVWFSCCAQSTTASTRPVASPYSRGS